MIKLMTKYGQIFHSAIAKLRVMLLQLPEGGKGDTPGSQLKGVPKFAKGGRGTKGIIQKK